MADQRVNRNVGERVDSHDSQCAPKDASGLRRFSKQTRIAHGLSTEFFRTSRFQPSPAPSSHTINRDPPPPEKRSWRDLGPGVDRRAGSSPITRTARQCVVLLGSWSRQKARVVLADSTGQNPAIGDTFPRSLGEPGLPVPKRCVVAQWVRSSIRQQHVPVSAGPTRKAHSLSSTQLPGLPDPHETLGNTDQPGRYRRCLLHPPPER